MVGFWRTWVVSSHTAPKAQRQPGRWHEGDLCGVLYGQWSPEAHGEGAQGLRGHRRWSSQGPHHPDARAGPHGEAQACLGSAPVSRITLPCVARLQTPWGSKGWRRRRPPWWVAGRGEAAPLEDLQGLEGSPGIFSIPLA